MYPEIARAIFKATSVEWTEELEDRDYARSIRRRVELSDREYQYVLSKIFLEEDMRAAH